MTAKRLKATPPPSCFYVEPEIPAVTDWIGLFVGITVPLASAVLFACYAWDPARFPAGFHEWLLVLVFAEIPLLILGGLFLAALSATASRVKRLVIYAVVLAVLYAFGSMDRLFAHAMLGPVLAWGVAGHVLSLLVLRTEGTLVRARASAILEDVWRLLYVLPALAILMFILTGVVLLQFRGADGRLPYSPPIHTFFWLAVAYFLMRAASVGYVHSASFVRRRRGLLDRAWLNRLMRHRRGDGFDETPAS